MKVNITISIDEGLYKEAREQRINLSGTLNTLLRDYLGPKKADSEEEEKAKRLLDLGKKLKMNFEEINYISETLEAGIVELWKAFKLKFRPDYDVYKFIEIRGEIKNVAAGNEKGKD